MKEVLDEALDVLAKGDPEFQLPGTNISGGFPENDWIFGIPCSYYHRFPVRCHREPLAQRKSFTVKSREKLRRYRHSLIVLHRRTAIINRKGIEQDLPRHSVLGHEHTFEFDASGRGSCLSLTEFRRSEKSLFRQRQEFFRRSISRPG